jgi:hypothetical protein
MTVNLRKKSSKRIIIEIRGRFFASLRCAQNLMLIVGQKFKKSFISLILKFKLKFQGSYKIILVIYYI